MQEILEGQSKIGVVLPSALTESFEIVLARIIDLVNAEEDVEIIQCDGAVKGCVANPFNIKLTCDHCKNVRDNAVDALKIPCRRLSINNESRVGFISEAKFSDAQIEDIKLSIESTILTFYRRKKENLNKADVRNLLMSHLAKNFFTYSKAIYVESKSLIVTRGLGRLEFFNGRIVPNYALLKSAQDAGVDFSIIEVAGIHRNILTVKNKSMHDLDYRQSALRKFIDSRLNREDQGVQFFESRRSGERTDTISFVKQQVHGMIKETEKPIFAIFTSSTDEFEFLGDQWFTEASKNPYSFILKLSKLIGNAYKIIVRMHPNQAGDYTGATKILEKKLRELDDVEVISPKERQSTYELIDKASVVLAFGSSVSVEATYARKPSILVGRAIWEFLDIAYYAETAETVAELLRNDLEAKSKIDAIAVASYYMIGDGVKGALSWDKDKKLFFVNGKNFLGKKRSSFIRYITRFLDKLLRLP